jgi:hypothetical protein
MRTQLTVETRKGWPPSIYDLQHRVTVLISADLKEVYGNGRGTTRGGCEVVF